jgi:uncharacterized protein (DUF1499 family)
MTPLAVISRAEKLAVARNWMISSKAADRLEATATESAFKFMDDIVIVATPASDGKSTIINMRSVSRVGASDFGVNANRIRAFLAELQK